MPEGDGPNKMIFYCIGVDNALDPLLIGTVEVGVMTYEELLEEARPGRDRVLRRLVELVEAE